MPEEPLLACRGLTLEIRRPDGRYFRPVDGIDLGLWAGRTLALVGASGSGKTTLARLLARLLPPTGGRILFGGRDVTDALPDSAFRRRVQIVFQDPARALNAYHSAGFILTQPLIVHGLVCERRAQQARVRQLLEQVGLSAHDAAKYPREFSGGQRQRLNLARALAVQPEGLILDEPISALDAVVGQQILELLQAVQQARGLSYLFICHDLSVVAQISDTVAVMAHGQIVERGPVQEVFLRPSHPATVALLAALPNLSQVIAE